MEKQQASGTPANNRLNSLSPEKRALLQRMLEEKAQSAGSAPSIPKRNSAGPWPVSFSQQTLFLADQMIEERSTYNVPTILLFRGGMLDIPALQSALDSLVERHEILRTTYSAGDPVPVQTVNPSRPVELTVMDIPGPDPHSAALPLCIEHARKPFDLEHDQMLRAAVLRVNSNESYLLFLSHHICSDGWSKTVFFRELSAFYTAFLNGAKADLPELPIQYADYAVWQRNALHSDTLQPQLAYWKETLAGAPPLLDLPADRPRPSVQSFRGARRTSPSMARYLEPLRKLARSEGTTLFMVYFGAFNVLLARYTGREDIIVGTPVLGRSRPEQEKLIGCFSNTLVMRTDVSGDPTFRELLNRIRPAVLKAFDNQDVPLDALVNELKVPRDPSCTPLFQILFGLGEQPLDLPQFGSLQCKVLRIDRGITKVDLQFGIAAREGDVGDQCEYSTDLFEGDTVQRLMSHFETLLSGIVENPDARISELPMLPAHERAQVLHGWNETQTAYSRGTTVPELFESQVNRTPDAPAAEFKNRSLSYRELNAKANQLAGFLRARGVGKGSMVAIWAERSLELAVSILGVLKSGATCVPLDPAHPPERLAFLLRESGAKLIVSPHGVAGGTLPAGIEVLDLKGMAHVLGKEPAENAAVAATPESAAYVLFTSGSTGEPKGVLLTHRGLVNHHTAAVHLYDLKASDRVLQFAPLTFDMSLEEMFPTWLSGGTVVFRPEDILSSDRTFSQWVADLRITVLDLPTAMWHQWVHELGPGGVPSCVRLVIVGGEKASGTVLAKWQQIARPGVQWINTYGPTEASIIASAFSLRAGEEVPFEIPIGKPIANTRLYVLDKRRQPVPIGVPGELYIGGDGLASGYLNKPELTAQKFVPDPFSEIPGARMYATGDQARFRSDGHLLYVGRVDEQVKIRGFRIELGEVEARIREFPGVKQVAVLAREDTPGDKRLAGYVVPEPGTAFDTDELRTWLKQRLPDYMMPSALMEMPKLPLMTNGKVDRKALPVPSRVQARADHREAESPLEHQLAGIWKKVLGVPSISTTDDFFDLGGHSLLAMRLITEIRAAFGRDFHLTLLFRAPTIESMAQAILRQSAEEEASIAIAIRASGSKPPLFCVTRPNVSAVGYVLLARHLGDDQPVYSLQLQTKQQQLGPYSQQQYEELACEYIRAMQAIQPCGPYLLTGFCEGAHIAFEMARQIDAKGGKVAMLGILDAWPIENTRKRSIVYLQKTVASLLRVSRMPATEKLAFVRRKMGSERPAHSTGNAGIQPLAEHPPIAPQTRSRQQDLLLAKQIAERWWPGKDFRPPTYNGTLVLFRAPNQPIDRIRDPKMGWGSRALGGVEVLPIPGKHSQILREPNVPVLARKMAASIDVALAAAEEAAAKRHVPDSVKLREAS